MTTPPTVERVARITDAGLFEVLATAVLRCADPLYRSLAHTGVNAHGKTIRSPVDGIGFELGTDPPRMIAVHHTTSARDGLRDKWLHDPATVTPRKGATPVAPAGDVVKTAALVADERTRRPGLRVTLVLTTNEEPSVDVIRDVVAAAAAENIDVDLWSRSRLCAVLDTDPDGQWIRRSVLGIEQERLSIALFRALASASLSAHAPPDDPGAWVQRALDVSLAESDRRAVTFLVSGSGLGKSVACYRRLEAHIDAGRIGLVIPHGIVAAATTLDQAVMMTLQQLHPAIDPTGPSALSFGSPDHPLLLIVEDINRSGQPAALAEKLAGWSKVRSATDGSGLSAWRVICPVWPEVVLGIREQLAKHVASLTVSAAGFVGDEGRDAVLARADGRTISASDAQMIARALGDDPLLIGLHDHATTPEPHRVIEAFIEQSLHRAARTDGYPASTYRHTLRLLGSEMLSHRHIDVTWTEISAWAALHGDPLRVLASLAQHGELLRLTGPSTNQRVAFRHDRVRDALLVDAAADLERRSILADEIVAEPFFAELMGATLAWGKPSATFLPRVSAKNPLALFCALSLVGHDSGSATDEILGAIGGCLDTPEFHDTAHASMRWDALTMLSETNSDKVPALVQRFRDETWASQLARLRNGDLSGGLELCIAIEPAVGAPWLDVLIEHAKLHHGPRLRGELAALLRRDDLDTTARVGALRLAGRFASSELAEAIETCWTQDPARDEQLAEYLWAFAECCGDDPTRYLRPVCDAWASLSDEPDVNGMGSPRDALAEFGPRWAFRRWPPTGAIEYFILRAAAEELRWPITHMLHGIDHPKAVEFVAGELAALIRQAEPGSFFPFPDQTRRDWASAQEDGRPMSDGARGRLLTVWRDDGRDRITRQQSFLLWAATQRPDDIGLLRAVGTNDALADDVLAQRLVRGDHDAIPLLVEKIAASDRGYWWQFGRHLWSPVLTASLSEFLARRASRVPKTWLAEVQSDSTTSELIMRLPAMEAERLLLQHWEQLRLSSYFVLAAFYVGTPRLLAAAHAAMAECPDPARLIEYVHYRFGIRMKGHPGLVREQQIRAIAPYLPLLSRQSIASLWDGCNERGWFSLRRELLDDLVRSHGARQIWTPEAAVAELDHLMAQHRGFAIERWIDVYAKADVSWTEMLALLMRWLDERRTMEALEVVTIAMRLRGTRADADSLRAFEGISEEGAPQFIADTQYAVRRRSIR